MQQFYGYMRVSTIGQNEERQRVDLLRFGIEDQNFFMDKQSGKNFERPQYKELKRKLKAKDVLAIKSLDRLGRNYIEIQDEWRDIVNRIKADIVVLDMPLLDTRLNKDLMGTLISDIVLQLLAYVAQSERENILQRQSEGISAARAQGKHLGRYSAPIPKEFYDVFEKYNSHFYSRKFSAETLGITENHFIWLCRRYRSELLTPLTIQVNLN